MTTVAQLMSALAYKDGINDTFIDGIKIYKASTNQERQPLSYRQGALFVGQGAKQVFLYDQCYEYNPENYLVLSVPLPAECMAFASPEKPILLLTLDFDITLLSEISALMNDHVKQEVYSEKISHKGLFLSQVTKDISNTLERLLTSLQSPLDASILGKGLVKELLFRIMLGENATALYALTTQNTNVARIDKALRLIHSDFKKNIAIDQLARLVNMSPSVFHRVFKEVTASPPLQYVKKIRLNHARILLGEGMRVGETAQEVGYESASQFSREFKRHFGTSPAEYC